MDREVYLEELVERNPRINKLYTFTPQVWFAARVGVDLFIDFGEFSRAVCGATKQIMIGKGRKDTLPSMQASTVSVWREGM